MRKKVILYSLFLLLIIFNIVIFSNPLRRSEERICEQVEKQTPIGSSYESVLTYMEKKEWYNSRFQGNDGKTRGIYLRGEIGRYRVFFNICYCFLGI